MDLGLGVLLNLDVDETADLPVKQKVERLRLDDGVRIGKYQQVLVELSSGCLRGWMSLRLNRAELQSGKQKNGLDTVRRMRAVLCKSCWMCGFGIWLR